MLFKKTNILNHKLKLTRKIAVSIFPQIAVVLVRAACMRLFRIQYNFNAAICHAVFLRTFL